MKIFKEVQIMKFNFSYNTKIIVNKNKVVLGNRQTGQWMRISKEVYDVFKLGIDNSISIEELKSSLHDDEDRAYIEDIYSRLCNIGIIEDELNKKVLQNKLVAFEITHKCNLRCIHCCMSAGENIENKRDLSNLQIKEALDKIVDWNPQRILLSGGEPMLRTDFNDILIYLRNKYKGRIVISTNATLINENNVDILVKNADGIAISLDGIDEESCSKVRGPGVFTKVMNSIELLKSKNFHDISLSMVTGENNENLEEDFYKLNKLIGTEPCIREFIPLGRGSNKENKSYFLDNEENKSYVPSRFLSDDYENPMVIRACSGGKREIFIGSNGDIYPCPSFLTPEYLIDNILNIDTLKNILNSEDSKGDVHTLLEDLEKINNCKCNECKVNLFCWTCLAEINRMKDNTEAINHKCSKVKKVLYKRVWG
jgi:radical SAM protein with 4Fe4S-binding SPASM domain